MMLLPQRQHAMRHACGVLSVIAGLCVLAGCVTSEASRYRGTMTRSVPPERRASADVAGAFKLNGDGDVSMAVVSD